MSTHNICFHCEIRKILTLFCCEKSALSGAKVNPPGLQVRCVLLLFTKETKQKIWYSFSYDKCGISMRLKSSHQHKSDLIMYLPKALSAQATGVYLDQILRKWKRNQMGRMFSKIWK